MSSHFNRLGKIARVIYNFFCDIALQKGVTLKTCNVFKSLQQKKLSVIALFWRARLCFFLAYNGFIHRLSTEIKKVSYILRRNAMTLNLTCLFSIG